MIDSTSVEAQQPAARATYARLWEVDVLRGVAIITMVIYHLVYDLVFFANYPFNLRTGFWPNFALGTALTFLFVSGMAMAIQYGRVSHGGTPQPYRDYLLRGLRLISYGMVITIVTFFIQPQFAIFFGILHLIGASTLLAYPFLRLRYLPLALGVVLLVFGRALQDVPIDSPWLLWLGLRPASYTSFDYWPLIPWFGVPLIGIFAGNMLYRDGQRRFPFVDLSRGPVVRQLSFLGRHSLLIYLIHQPILIVLLVVFGVIELSTLL